MKPYYDEDGITIYHGDAREILNHVSFDALVTDPPYAIGAEYDTYEDTEANLDELMASLIRPALEKATTSAITPGVGNVFRYPRPRWMLAWFWSGGGGSGPWGFSQWQPVLAYGTDPFLAQGLGRRPDTLQIQAMPESNGHPCPKPLRVMSWIVERTTRPTDIVFDPFMGSGTTLRAAKDSGRRAVGVELEERYCDLAVQRLAQGVLPL